MGLRIPDDKVSEIGTISRGSALTCAAPVNCIPQSDVIDCFLDLQQEAHQASNHEAWK